MNDYQVWLYNKRGSKRMNEQSGISNQQEPIRRIIRVTGTTYDGSRGERVVIAFSTNLTPRQKDFICQRLRNGDCKEHIHAIRWRNNRTIVVTVKYASISECARIDVLTVTKHIIRRAPHH